MANKENVHFGPVTSIEIRADGERRVGGPIHGTEGLATSEVKDAIVENYGIDPARVKIRKRSIGKEVGKASVSFSGKWSGSTWEPTGPRPNYGYTSNMN